MDRAAIPPGQAGTQTLARGLDVLRAVADGAASVAALASRTGLARSTAHRLAAALVEQRFLALDPRDGYRLGPMLIALGEAARTQNGLTRIARAAIEALADATGDTVHLGVRDGAGALYLDKIPGRRRVEISSRVGDRHPLRSTGLGKALLLDATEAEWRAVYAADDGGTPAALADWLASMRDYARRGVAFDLGENEDGVRCAAAPVRDALGRIAGAISVSGAAHYMGDERLATLAEQARAAADAIGRALGWEGTR